MSHKPKPGERVAHRSLDSKEGAARSGIAVDVLGDEKQSLVVVESEDGREAFDTREMVSLGPASRSSGPVILRPSHLKTLLHSRQAILALILEVVLIGALVASWAMFGLEGKSLLVSAAAVMIVGMILIVLLERDAQRGRLKPGER